MKKPKLVRQAKFREDMSLTDVPARDSEKPQLEGQASLTQWAVDQGNLEKLKNSVEQAQ